MSNLKRLTRVIKSWKGKITRDVYYEGADAFMILTDLGLQMSPQTLAYLTSSDSLKDDFVDGLYAAEEKAGKLLVVDNQMIDPAYDPKVYEEGREVIFTVKIKDKEVVFAEFPLPFEVYNSTNIEIED
ncbi:MAG: hypothetical protein H6581_06830 [Bacteroidia bacterium]|nr:hypothetical protein [Bacteroidia bacterium]